MIIEAYASHLALSIKDSRRFCRVWEGFMMSKRETVDKHLSPEFVHLYDDFARRFFQHELVFFPLNLQRIHWIVVCMNVKKKEFQIMDSLWNSDMSMEAILELRSGIQRMTAFARKKFPELPKRVDTWEINFIKNVPMQSDGHSCGLFALKFMECWNGTKMEGDFTQDDVSILRRKLPTEIIFSAANELEMPRQEIELIMQLQADKIMHARNPTQK
ncbi:unnamed protein product [Urochloa decumbens]|uniref:Ubiquitin-like protease family profile domain-containing protein n=1 Tax=Urochloa decumbens TaxID=240449 RepID=A0ABC9EK92_9POAL